MSLVPSSPPKAFWWFPPVKAELPGWTVFVGGHPLPNEESFAAGRAILERLARCDERTLIFFLISGGGSSLVEQPLDPAVTLADFAQLHSALITCGAPIERNQRNPQTSFGHQRRAPRRCRAAFDETHARHQRRAARGRNPRWHPGPTLPDPTTIHDASASLAEIQTHWKSFLRRSAQPSRLARCAKRRRSATPPSSARISISCSARTICCTRRIMRAKPRGSLPLRQCDGQLAGRESCGLSAGAAGSSCARKSESAASRFCAMGELSSPVTGDGIGGRNSAFVLACVAKIAGKKNYGPERRYGRNRRQQPRGRRCRGRRDAGRARERPRSGRLLTAQRLLQLLRAAG